MKNPITSLVLKAAAELEAKARLIMNAPKESVLPQPVKQNRKLAFTHPKDFDKATWVAPYAETASFVSEGGVLLFVIIY